MSNLTDAMHDAVASVEGRRSTAPSRGTADHGSVQVLDLDGLPPVRYQPMQARSVADLMEEQGGATWRHGWQVFSEAVRVMVLFWGSAVGVAFIDAMSEGGLGGTTMLWSSLGTTAVLRGVLAFGRRKR